MRILIIDDEEFFAKTISSFLNQNIHADVNYVISSVQALKVLQEEKYDIIISDIRLPDSMYGELLLQISDLNPKQAFIVMSAYEIPNTILNKEEINIIASFEKPFDMHELQNILSSYVGEKN